MSRNFESGLELNDWLVAEQEFVKMLIKRYLNICSEDGGLTLIGLQRFSLSLGIENAETFIHKDELKRNYNFCTSRIIAVFIRYICS